MENYVSCKTILLTLRYSAKPLLFLFYLNKLLIFEKSLLRIAANDGEAHRLSPLTILSRSVTISVMPDVERYQEVFQDKQRLVCHDSKTIKRSYGVAEAELLSRKIFRAR